MPLYGLMSTGTIVGIGLLVFAVVLSWALLRNRVRCPKDRAPMQLVPGAGQHMVFKCPKCGHKKKTHIRKGRR